MRFTERYGEESASILEVEEEQQKIGQENHDYINGNAEARQRIERSLFEE